MPLQGKSAERLKFAFGIFATAVGKVSRLANT